MYIYIYICICIFIYTYIYILHPYRSVWEKGCMITYDSFHWKCCTPEIYQIEKLRFLGISRTILNWDFGWIWICTEKFEFADLVDFGGVTFSVESVIMNGTDLWAHLLSGVCERERLFWLHNRTDLQFGIVLFETFSPSHPTRSTCASGEVC